MRSDLDYPEELNLSYVLPDGYVEKEILGSPSILELADLERLNCTY